MSIPLGKTVSYPDKYDPSLLFPIERRKARSLIGADVDPLPFRGYDTWNSFELSWLGELGLPQVAVCRISYDCSSPCIVESKSLKLYLGSFNSTRFPSAESVQTLIGKDLCKAVGGAVTVDLFPPERWQELCPASFQGELIDQSAESCDVFTPDPSLLSAGGSVIEETLGSNLLRTLCPVTSQPDWGSVMVRYQGMQISKPSLLRYLVSLRNHTGFHEECCERIYMDISKICRPEMLIVGCFFTRRGGIDINPVRCSLNVERVPSYVRLLRQ